MSFEGKMLTKSGNKFLLLSIFALTLLLASAAFIASEDFSIFGPVHQTTLNGSLVWSNFDFSGLAYASNGDGKFEPMASCNPFCSQVYDMRSVWVAQDQTFLAWKILAKNLTNATFCGGQALISYEIEFDADGNVSTGCRKNLTYQDTCYPGADFHLNIDTNGNGSFQYYNGTGPVSCTSMSCFNTSNNISVFVNISKTAGVCDENPSTIKLAVNKSNFKWSVLTFGIASKPGNSSPPIDAVGANKNDFDQQGFGGGGNFFQPAGNSSFMFRKEGCGSFTNESYCSTGSLNGNLSCIWESQFNNCRPNFKDTTSYGCSDFCGSCSTNATCQSGNRGTCKWAGQSGTVGNCMEDFSKIRYGGNCDSRCADCFGQTSCNSSRASGGCSWLTDQVRLVSFCAETGTTVKTCGPNTETTSCFGCNATGCISSANAGLCAFDNASNFCFMNTAGSEYSCFDGVDNNANSLIDCKDPQCSSDKYCGGGEFDKKILTDIVFVQTMKTLGVCVDSPSGLNCDKEKAMLFESAQAIQDKPGPPLKLKDDTDASVEPPMTHQWLNILGFAYKDMGKSLGMGMMLGGGMMTAACSGQPTSVNGTGIYAFYLDTDANQHNGCWEIINGKNVTGIEYKFFYNVSVNNSQVFETRKGFRCLQNSSNLLGLYPVKVSNPQNPFDKSTAPLCMMGALVLSVPIVDIGNPSSSIVYHVAASDGNGTHNFTKANDTLYNATYTPGAVDFVPPDCEKNPFACGTAFAKLGGGKFVPFEDCGTGSPDEDEDGTANCDDVDCVQAPWCSGNRATLLANDKTAPSVLTNIVDVMDRFAFLRQSTNEPSNMSVEFYNTSSSCTASLFNLTDTVPGLEFDRFRPWHSIIFDNKSITNTNLAPLASSTTYYYRTQNCDLSGNCAVSACLNFTTKASGNKNFNFGILFDPKGGPTMSGLNLTYYNGSHYVSLINVSNISFISNTTLKFDNPNMSYNGTTKGWNIEFEGVDLAKAGEINMTDMITMTQVNESVLGQPTQTRMLVGMNGTKWQEMAQLLGIDSVIINISQGGSTIIKCDTNGSNCIDVSANVTVLARGENYTTIKIPTYGLGGFSSYGVNTTGVQLISDKSSYQCYPSCTIYWNVTNYMNNLSQTLNLTLSIKDSSNRSTYNFSYFNHTDQAWILAPMANTTNLTNYNFTTLNSNNGSASVHQFRIWVSMERASAELLNFNFTISNNSGFASSWYDVAWIDAINTTVTPEYTTNIQTPTINFTLLSLNDTTQVCRLNINGSTYVNDSVVNNTVARFLVNRSLNNGSFFYNITCTNDLTGDSGNSSVRWINVSDNTIPAVNSTPSASVTSTAATITWTTNEFTNTSPLGYGTSVSSLTSNGTETGFTISHSVDIGSLTASTQYFYNITACDLNKNCNVTGPYNLTTSAASSGSGSGGSGGGGGGGGGGAGATETGVKVSRVWSSLPVGVSVMNLAKTEIAVRKLSIESAAAATNAGVDIIKLDKAPSVGATSGKAYQYLQIDTANILATSIKGVDIEFVVEKKWLTSNSIAHDKIALFRYAGGKWSELKTSVSTVDTALVSYKAHSPGFSYFAVASKSTSSTPAKKANDTKTKQTSGTNLTGATGSVVSNSTDTNSTSIAGNANNFMKNLLAPGQTDMLVKIIAGAIVAIAAIGAVIYLVFRKKGEQPPAV